MILRGSLSVRGLYIWDNDLFENLVVPDGVDKEVLCSNILSELGELEVLYPDSDYMKEIIGYWSTKELIKWNKINSVLNKTYDPTNNYTRHTVHQGADSRTNTNKVKAYNESTDYVDYQQDVASGNDSFVRDITGTNGVYSFQKLIKEELELREDYNIYDVIVRDFKRRFCIMAY